jgi:hypothetical protein
MTSTCMPSLFRYRRKLAGRGLTDFPVPISKISGGRKTEGSQASTNHAGYREDTPGLGTTTSKTSNLLSSQSFHNVEGTSQSRTSPSRNIHAEGNNLPSCSSTPAGVMDLTCTGGGISPARMFVNCGHLLFLSALVVCSALRGARERIAIDNMDERQRIGWFNCTDQLRPRDGLGGPAV